jgi:hypothetical protein
VAHCLEQVRLAQPGAAVDEQGVVGLCGRFRDSEGGSVGEAVAGTDDEALKSVLLVEPSPTTDRDHCGFLRHIWRAGRGYGYWLVSLLIGADDDEDVERTTRCRGQRRPERVPIACVELFAGETMWCGKHDGVVIEPDRTGVVEPRVKCCCSEILPQDPEAAFPDLVQIVHDGVHRHGPSFSSVAITLITTDHRAVVHTAIHSCGRVPLSMASHRRASLDDGVREGLHQGSGGVGRWPEPGPRRLRVRRARGPNERESESECRPNAGPEYRFAVQDAATCILWFRGGRKGYRPVVSLDRLRGVEPVSTLLTNANDMVVVAVAPLDPSGFCGTPATRAQRPVRCVATMAPAVQAAVRPLL